MTPDFSAVKGARELRTATRLTDQFILLLVICHTPALAVAFQRWLAPSLAGDRLFVERLSPYPFSLDLPCMVTVDRQSLTDLVLGGLVRHSLPRRAVFLDAARAATQTLDLDAWRWLFMRLNERRNLIAQGLQGPLILLHPPALHQDLAILAPDFWSSRSRTVEVGVADHE